MVISNKNMVFLIIVVLTGVISLAISIFRLDPIWIAMSVFYIFLMYGLTKIEETFYREINLDTLKKDLFILTLFPLLAGSAGIGRLIETSLVLGDITFIFLSSLFAFIILLLIDDLTDLRSNRLFAVSFVISFTISAGTLFIIIRYFTDIYMDTSYLRGNTHLMFYLLMLSILSVIIGLGFNDYILSSEYFMLENIRSDPEVRAPDREVRKEFLNVLNILFGRYNNIWLDIGSRILQLSIVAIVIYGIYSSRWPVIAWGIFSMIFAFSPDMFRINTGVRSPSLISIWITSLLFIFAFGRPMRFYGIFDWWAGFTHFLAGSAVSILVFSSFIYINRKLENLFIPIWLLLLLVLLSISPIGIIWEISEFIIDRLLDTSIQAGLDDTIYDLICNFFGSLFTVVLIYLTLLKECRELNKLSL